MFSMFSCISDSKQNNKYMQILLNSMTGSTKEESKKITRK